MLCRWLTVDDYACTGKGKLESKKGQGTYLSVML